MFLLTSYCIFIAIDTSQTRNTAWGSQTSKIVHTGHIVSFCRFTKAPQNIHTTRHQLESSVFIIFFKPRLSNPMVNWHNGVTRKRECDLDYWRIYQVAGGNFVIISAASVEVPFEDITTRAKYEMFLNSCMWSLWCKQSNIRPWLTLLASHFPAIFWSPWHAHEFQDMHQNAFKKGRKRLAFIKRDEKLIPRIIKMKQMKFV